MKASSARCRSRPFLAMLLVHVFFFESSAFIQSVLPLPRTRCVVRMISNDNTKADFSSSIPQLTRSAFLSLPLLAAVTAASTSVPATANAEPLSSKGVLLSATPDTTTPPQDTGSLRRTREESISGFVAGAALAATKTMVKYPLDTATVRLQMPGTDYSVYQPGRLLQGSFRGITTPLLGNIPAGAVFFAVKDTVKEFLVTSGADWPRWATTSLAVLAATFPYMVVRNPSEVMKTRQQAGVEGYGEGVSAWQAFRNVQQGVGTETNTNNNTALDTVARFYVGYWENVLYTYPADVIKFVAYENLSGGRKNIPPLQGAIYGALSTATAQVLTTPLDVLRNRVMAGKDATTSTTADEAKPSYLESLTRIAREEGVAGLFAGVSPRIGKALLSGAIQFATYEETKQVLATYFQSKRS